MQTQWRYPAVRDRLFVPVDQTVQLPQLGLCALELQARHPFLSDLGNLESRLDRVVRRHHRVLFIKHKSINHNQTSGLKDCGTISTL